MLRLHPECPGERLDDLVRRDRTVAVHEVVQIARRQLRLVGERPIRMAGLVHQPLDRRAEPVFTETSASRYDSFSKTSAASSSEGTGSSSPFTRLRTSTIPSSR